MWSTAPPRLRVLILEREPGTRARLAAAVGSDPSFEVVTTSGSEDNLTVLAAGARPDVALVGSGLDQPGGAELIRELNAASGHVQCVALSGGDDAAELVHMLAAGAVGCVPKSADAPAITEAIQSLGLHHVQLDRGVAASLFAQLAETLRREPEVTAAAGVEGRAARVQEIIADRCYEMVFQPVVALDGGDVLGMEALARFSAVQRRAPDEWLRDAESVGLRCPLEEALLRAALSEEVHLPPGAFMAVNLSPESALSGALARAVPASLLRRVVVEITDHQDVSDYAALAEGLVKPRAEGLRVAVDDSGQGLASLHEILRLAPDFVKLNRALVRDIDRDPTRRALAFALNSVAAQIGASVIAEGIETTAELQALRSLGIASGQGYLIGRPEPLAQAASRVSLPREVPRVRPSIVLPGRALRTFLDAGRAAFGLLERELPGSGMVVAQLDHRARRYRVLAASEALAANLEPGFNVPLEQSLCAHMATGRGPRVCADAALDGVYGGLDLQHRLRIASYAGVPLELEGSARLGSLCAISPEPDRYDEGTLEMLHAVAPVLMRALEDELMENDDVSAVEWLRTLSSRDHLTGTLNRLSFLDELDREARGQNRRNPRKFAVHVEVDGISGVRDRYGRAVAELAVREIADALVGAGRRSDTAGRLGDAEFGVALGDRDTPEQASYYCALVTQRLRQAFAKRGITIKARAGLAPLDGRPGREALAAARTAARPIT